VEEGFVSLEKKTKQKRDKKNFTNLAQLSSVLSGNMHRDLSDVSVF